MRIHNYKDKRGSERNHKNNCPYKESSFIVLCDSALEFKLSQLSLIMIP
jgi:hypothetical protein